MPDTAPPLPLIDHRRIVDALPDAVIAADVSNRVVFANAAAHQLLGVGAQPLEGMPLVELMPERMRELHTTAFTRYVDTWEGRLLGQTIAVPMLRADGTELPIELTLNPGASEEGDLLVIAVLRPTRRPLSY
jgi:protein-histidine pros-kinase